MRQNPDTTVLCQRWTRSNEEDTNTEEVYRPANYAFPPRRSRVILEFHPDGTFKRIAVGPTDISQVKKGTWQLDTRNADQVHIEVNGKPEVITIQDLKRDRLSIKRRS